MKKIIKKNPFVAFVLYPMEYEALKRESETHGVSVAQLARGYLRTAMLNTSQHKDDGQVSTISAVRLGRME